MSLDFGAEERALLARFPKSRAELPECYREIYSGEYFKNREGLDLASRVAVALESWMHRTVAARGRSITPPALLELGAGTLNHVAYEPRAAAYDIVEPFAELVEASGRRGRVGNVYGEIRDLPADARYGRIISIAVLEHVLDLPRVVAKACLHLDDSGALQAAIPSEGGLLWYLSWRLKGIPFQLRTGLDYGYLTRWEHVNTASEIQAIVELFFGRLVIKRFPLRLLHGSLYTYIEGTLPKRERARRYLEETDARL